MCQQEDSWEREFNFRCSRKKEKLSLLDILTVIHIGELLFISYLFDLLQNWSSRLLCLCLGLESCAFNLYV